MAFNVMEWLGNYMSQGANESQNDIDRAMAQSSLENKAIGNAFNTMGQDFQRGYIQNQPLNPQGPKATQFNAQQAGLLAGLQLAPIQADALEKAYKQKLDMQATQFVQTTPDADILNLLAMSGKGGTTQTSGEVNKQEPAKEKTQKIAAPGKSFPDRLMMFGAGLSGREPTNTLMNLQKIAGQEPMQAGMAELSRIQAQYGLPQQVAQSTKELADAQSSLINRMGWLQKMAYGVGLYTPPEIQALQKATSALAKIQPLMQAGKIEKISQLSRDMSKTEKTRKK